MKHENISNDFIQSLESPVKSETKAKIEKETTADEIPEPDVITKEDNSEELKILAEIDLQIADHKEQASIEHKKGMFENAINLYNEAEAFIESKESSFKNLSHEVLIRKCALWNNIAACYKQMQHHDKEIEFSTKVIACEGSLENDPNMLFKAYYRRGLAYEKIEKYTLANSDMQYCKQKQPFNMDVTKAVTRIKSALDHEEMEKKARSMMSPETLKSKLEASKKLGNDAFKANKFDEAIDHFTEAINLYKENKEVIKVENRSELNLLAISVFTNRCL